MKLNPQQQTAAERLSQDVCVVAGPGSGKTRTLVARFRWLIEQGVPIGRILAFTFTDKAATEIRLRLAEQFAAQPEALDQINRAWITTMHGFCARLLRENAIAAGVDVGFAVWEEVASNASLRQAAEEALDEYLADGAGRTHDLLTALDVSTSPFGRRPDLPAALISVYEATRIAGEDLAGLASVPISDPLPRIADIIAAVEPILHDEDQWSTAKRREKRDAVREWVEKARQVIGEQVSDEQVTVQHFRLLDEFHPELRGLKDPSKTIFSEARDVLAPRVLGALATRYFMPQREALVAILRRIDAIYRARKAEASALDFSDLEERAASLLADHPATRERIRNRFDHILMDELQDTNPLQWRFVNLIRRPGRFFAVGDPNQSIFGFRHADPNVYRSFREELERAGRKVDKLSDNWRSRPEILSSVRELLDDQPGLLPEAMKLEPKRVFPAKSGPSVECWVAQAETTQEAEVAEARWAAHRIAAIRAAEGRPYRDFAVLARKITALRTIEQALREARLPCQLIGGRTLLECREVRDLTLAYAVIANTEDEVSLAGVLRSPLVGVSDETLLRLKLRGRLWESLGDCMECDPEDAERIEWFRNAFTSLRRDRDAVSPDILLTRVLDESGYEAGLSNHERTNIEKFLVLLRGIWVERPVSSAELMERISELRSAESEAEAPPAEATEAVRLMSIHKAKGLEFPVVCVVALHQGGSSELDPICYSAAAGFGVRWRNPATGKRAADVVFGRVEGEQVRRQSEEDMRLLYVAMTRAEDHLVLTYSAAERSKGSAWSRLIAERLDPQPTGEPALEELSAPEPEPAAADPVVVDPPYVTNQHDSSVPVTHLAEFADCPRRYYLGRYLGMDFPQVVTPGQPSAADIGTQVHQLLAGEEVEDPAPDAVEMVERFHSGGLAARMSRASRVEHEFDFRFELEDIVLRGKIDLWFEEGGELILVDYKTDRDEAHLASYELQLRLYALALERLTGRIPDRAILCYLRSNRDVDVSVDSEALNTARQTLRRFRDAQEHLDFPLDEADHCTHCPFYRAACPAGH